MGKIMRAWSVLLVILPAELGHQEGIEKGHCRGREVGGGPIAHLSLFPVQRGEPGRENNMESGCLHPQAQPPIYIYIYGIETGEYTPFPKSKKKISFLVNASV